MFEKINIQNILDSDRFAEASQNLGMLMMSTALLATVSIEVAKHRAIIPNQANVTPIADHGASDSSRREKEAEVHETHLHSRINQRTPARSGRI
jgi:hypothetical protein